MPRVHNVFVPIYNYSVFCLHHSGAGLGPCTKAVFKLHLGKTGCEARKAVAIRWLKPVKGFKDAIILSPKLPELPPLALLIPLETVYKGAPNSFWTVGCSALLTPFCGSSCPLACFLLFNLERGSPASAGRGWGGGVSKSNSWLQGSNLNIHAWMGSVMT